MASKPSERFVWAVETLALDPADRVLESAADTAWPYRWSASG
jgi:hypothetical protein